MKFHLDLLRSRGYEVTVTSSTLTITPERGQAIEPDVKQFLGQYPLNDMQIAHMTKTMSNEIANTIILNELMSINDLGDDMIETST